MPKIRKGSLIKINGLGYGIVISDPEKNKDNMLVGDVFWVRPGALVRKDEAYTQKEYLGDARIIAD